MSLEQVIEQNTLALKEVAEALRALKGTSVGVGTSVGTTVAAPAAAAVTKVAETKVAEKSSKKANVAKVDPDSEADILREIIEEEEAAQEAAASEPATPPTPELDEKFFLTKVKPKAVKLMKENIGALKAIVDGYGVAKVSEVGSEHWLEMLEKLNAALGE